MTRHRGTNDYEAMNALTGRHEGKRGLIILGGPSGKSWQYLRDKIKPDVLISVNGMSDVIGEELDYWLFVESWPAELPVPPGFQSTKPKTRIVTWKMYGRLDNKEGVISVRRGGPRFENDTWSSRHYQGGLANGPLMPAAKWTCLRKDHRLGTIGLQTLHLAAILGLREVRTIGFDLCIKDDRHHWYEYMDYQQNTEFWYPSIWTEFAGYKTNHWWIESAKWLKNHLRMKLYNEGMLWNDSSDGLLEAV